MKNNFRCACPVTSALDIVGDKWSLVIIKQMLYFGTKTFKEFSELDESIASNILSSRLKKLEEYQIISKQKLPNNKKANIYTLTEKGLDLTRTIVELTLWGERNIKEFHPNMYTDQRIEMLKKNKEEVIPMIIESYKSENWSLQNKLDD